MTKGDKRIDIKGKREIMIKTKKKGESVSKGTQTQGGKGREEGPEGENRLSEKP